MRLSSYLNCNSYYGIFTGIPTGSIEGIYDFSSGASGIIYNLIYPTGSHFVSGNIYSPKSPLVSVGKTNATNYLFTGQNAYRVGYTQSGDWAFLMDMEYSGCAKTTTGIGHILLSTTDAPTGIDDTFYIGINDANRLFFGASGRYDQLPYELKTRNLVYVSLSEQKYVNYGVFDYLNQTFRNNAIELENDQKLINKIYLGGFLNNTNTDFTGFFGRINDAVFYNEHITSEDVQNCSNCLFVTGQTNSPNVGTYVVPAITGYVLSGVSGQVLTGSILVTGEIFNSTGGLINVVFDSGIWANIQTGQITTLLTGSTTVYVTGRDFVTFANDTNKINNFNVYDIEFNCPLYSGDIVEIYGHNAYNPYVNFPILDLSFPASDNFVQLVGNGLVETNGLDYQVVRNSISGFFLDDTLGYDIYSGNSAIMPYSGFWPRSRILMSGGSYFPPTGQFGERSGTMVTGHISGVAITQKSNFFLNGQKLISGVHYNIKNDQVFNYYGLTGFVVEFYPSGSGIASDFVADVLYAPNGSGTGIGEVQDAELTMLDTWDTNYIRYLYEMTGVQSIINNITGFNEQVWVNGVRQNFGNNYVKNFACNTIGSGTVDQPNTPLLFVENDGEEFFNLG